MVDDVFGVDFKILRTLRDMIMRPRRVTEAALANDRSLYSPPMRVFLALFALQTLVFGWIGVSDGMTFGTVFANDPDALAVAQSILADADYTLAQADAVISEWAAWLNWPITAIASLLYVLVIWALRPSLGLYSSFMLFWVSSNASSTLGLPMIVGSAFVSPEWLLAATGASLVIFWIYAGIVMAGRIARTGVGLTVRMGVIVTMTIPVILIIYIMMFVVKVG